METVATMEVETVVMAETIPATGVSSLDEKHEIHVLNGKGVHNLIIAVIGQAVADYKQLEKWGVVLGGKLIAAQMPCKRHEEMSLSEAKETLSFFEDKNIGLLLTMGGMKVDPKQIRSKLGFAW
jgi:hypothetical protein